MFLQTTNEVIVIGGEKDYNSKLIDDKLRSNVQYNDLQESFCQDARKNQF